MDSEHAVLIGFENHVLSAVEVRGLARRAREFRALAVCVVAVLCEDVVAVDAAAEGHICIRERGSVRLQEGDLSHSRETQGKRVQRVELALRPVALSALKRDVRECSAIRGSVVRDARAPDFRRDSVRLIERERAVGVRVNGVRDAETVLIGYLGLHRRGELEEIELILQPVHVDLNAVGKPVERRVRSRDDIRPVAQSAEHHDDLRYVARVGEPFERLKDAAAAVIDRDRPVELACDFRALTGGRAPPDRVVQRAPVVVGVVYADGLEQSELASELRYSVSARETAKGLAIVIDNSRSGACHGVGDCVLECRLIDRLSADENFERAVLVYEDRAGRGAPCRVGAVLRLRGHDVVVFQFRGSFRSEGDASGICLPVAVPGVVRLLDDFSVFFDRERELAFLRVVFKVEVLDNPAERYLAPRDKLRVVETDESYRRGLRADDNIRGS